MTVVELRKVLESMPEDAQVISEHEMGYALAGDVSLRTFIRDFRKNVFDSQPGIEGSFAGVLIR